ncbi:MAG: von Willebrand factor type A domain-containing protein [Planctomycetes bacterium]|nr:von Willebrand factor type A domain-containing protein [Planctomycetota bacterium]
MSCLLVRGRRLFAVGAPVFLFAVLVGCGRQEKATQPDVPPDKNTSNGDPGLEWTEAALPEIARRDKQTTESAITADNIGRPNVPDTDTTALAAPGLSTPGVAGDSGAMLAGAGGNSGTFHGRSGATKTRLLREGGAAGSRPAPTGYNAANAEAYGVYQENEFRSPLVAALSTFSADVNTASYSNVRRTLADGKPPPASAVFLAEFVNYFPYSYAQPKGDDPVAFHVELGACPWNRKHHLVRIGVQVHQIPADKMPPRNLVFLIDTSGSMHQENRLPLVQKSLGLLVDQLGEKDRVSVVTYAGDSRVALAPTRGTDKKTITDVVNGLAAGGGTNGEGGIRRAYELARATFIDGGVNRVILCTDGDFNVGVTDNGELVKLIEEQRRSKVFLTILGFGMGNYKDDRLKELANHGNGHHAYIDTLDEAKKVFVEQGAALVCVAKDVKFQVDFNPARVTAYRLVGYENRLLKDEDFKNDAKDAGDLGSGHQVTVFYEIVPKGVNIDLPGVDPSKYQKKDVPENTADEWLTVKMRYKHPEAEISKELAQPLKGDVAKELSDDFRFAAAVASFGMILRDSKFRGAMTYSGVLEEAQGCVGADPNGHRRQFLELVRTAKRLSEAAKDVGPNEFAKSAGIDEKTLRELAEAWSGKGPDPERAKKIAEALAKLPPQQQALAKEYFARLERAQDRK